jgi:hypothetical protein
MLMSSELQTTIYKDGYLEIYKSLGEGAGWLIYCNPKSNKWGVREFTQYGGGEFDHGPFDTFLSAFVTTTLIESQT